MAAVDKGPTRIFGVDTSGDFDDVGALVVAMRHMLDEGELSPGDRRALYVMACMAELAWRRLDDAMMGQAS